MLSPGTEFGTDMLSSGGRCYHLGLRCYHLWEDIIIWDGSVIILYRQVIIWGKMVSSRTELLSFGMGMLSSEKGILLSGVICYHLG